MTNTLEYDPAAAFDSDAGFDAIYPPGIRAQAARYWTPLAVARAAAAFLAPGNKEHVLDIGSGVGKFCLAAAQYKPGAFFYGVEQRKHLVDVARGVRSKLGIVNVSFVHGNFTQLDLRPFDHFYFYNAFYENLDGVEKIDHTIEHSMPLFYYYNRYLYKQLEKKPTGTRVATYHSIEDEMPPSYHAVESSFEGLLKCWVKIE